VEPSFDKNDGKREEKFLSLTTLSKLLKNFSEVVKQPMEVFS
jgi:hypothetical protein